MCAHKRARNRTTEQQPTARYDTEKVSMTVSCAPTFVLVYDVGCCFSMCMSLAHMWRSFARLYIHVFRCINMYGCVHVICLQSLPKWMVFVNTIRSRNGTRPVKIKNGSISVQIMRMSLSFRFDALPKVVATLLHCSVASMISLWQLGNWRPNVLLVREISNLQISVSCMCIHFSTI